MEDKEYLVREIPQHNYTPNIRVFGYRGATRQGPNAKSRQRQLTITVCAALGKSGHNAPAKAQQGTCVTFAGVVHGLVRLDLIGTLTAVSIFLMSTRQQSLVSQ